MLRIAALLSCRAEGHPILHWGGKTGNSATKVLESNVHVKITPKIQQIARSRISLWPPDTM